MRIPSLDGGGKLPEKFVPSRLSEAALTAKIAADAYTKTVADDRFAPFLFGPRAPTFTLPRRPKRSLVTAWQVGHGWTVNGGAAASNAADTADFVFGSQSQKLTATTTSGAFNYRSPAYTSMDLTGKKIRVLLKVTGVAFLTDLRVQVGDTTIANGRSIKVPYNTTDLAGSYLKDGEWQWISVDPGDGTVIGTGQYNAVTNFQVRITQPSGGNLTVNLGAIEIEDAAAGITGGILCFTFDDTYVSQYTIAKPMLDAKGWAATAFPIADKVATSTNAQWLSVAQCQNLAQYSRWEFGVHSMTGTGHNAVGGFTGLSDTSLQDEIVNGRDFLHSNGLGIGEGLAWPQGASNIATERTAAKIVSYARSNTAEGYEPLPPANRMRIRSIPISAATTDTLINGYITAANARNKMLCLTIHDVVASGATGIQMNQAVLQSIIDHAATTGINVMTMSDALKVA